MEKNQTCAGVVDDPAPRLATAGGKDGHSALRAIEMAREVGAWLERNPDRTLWSMRIDLRANSMMKLLVFEVGGGLVLATEATTSDLERICDALGSRRRIDETVSVFTADGMDLRDAAEVAALVS